MPLKAKSNNVVRSSGSTSTTTILSPELEQQFEAELCWCIQQLQTALKSGKLNNKQVQDHTKALNTLMSNSSPMIKKRQIMRLSFGDYRAKMLVEEKKYSRNAININVKPATPNKKSTFIKKSHFISSGNKFRFNFEQSSDHSNTDKVTVGIESIKIEPVKNFPEFINKDFTFVPSDNNFRFSFDTESGEL